LKKNLEKQILKELQRARGTKDFLPEVQIPRQKLIENLKKTFENFGFSPLDTPIIERMDVLSSKYAGGAEILKESFQLTDQGGRTLGIRYDLTVPLARVIGMNPQLKMPFKRYAIGPVLRDGPISHARYRQFIQCDVDIIGSKEMKADSEILTIAAVAFKNLDFKIIIKVSNRKILDSILEKLNINENKRNAVILSIDKLVKFGPKIVIEELKEQSLTDEKIEEVMNFINIQGSNEEKIKQLNKLLPNNEGVIELETVIEYMKLLGIEIDVDPSLARGLSYYTGTIFEIYLKDSKIRSSVCSGGRWDKMIGDFVGKGDFPAVGISFGLDRIFDAYIEKNPTSTKTNTKLFLIPIGTYNETLVLASEFRQAGINVELDLNSRGISKNLNYANAMGIPFVVFIGENELKAGKLKIKDMKLGSEEELSKEDIIEKLRN